METTQGIVVAGIVHNAGKFLVLKRSSSEDIFPNKWELPSGKVDFGEDPNEALVREIKEETGMLVKDFFPFKMTHYTLEKPGKKKHTIQIISLIKFQDDINIVLSGEHDKYKWISVEELNNLDTFEDMHKILRNADSFLKNYNHG